MVARLSQGQFILLLCVLLLFCAGSLITWNQPKMGYYDWTDAEAECRATGLTEVDGIEACVATSIRLNYWVRLGQWFMRYLGLMLAPATLWLLFLRFRGSPAPEAQNE